MACGSNDERPAIAPAAAQDPDDVVAYHEAGHAVASHLLRGFVGTVTITAPDQAYAGGTQVWILAAPLVDDCGRVVEKGDYDAAEIDDFEAAVMIAMAGPIAETLYWPSRTYDSVLMRNADDEGKILSITRKVWSEDPDRAEANLRERTRKLLEENWGIMILDEPSSLLTHGKLMHHGNL